MRKNTDEQLNTDFESNGLQFEELDYGEETTMESVSEDGKFEMGANEDYDLRWSEDVDDVPRKQNVTLNESYANEYMNPEMERVVEEAVAEAKAAKDEEDTRTVTGLIKILSMMIFAFVVFIFASIAWFTMNKNVGTEGMGIKASSMPFEVSVDSPYTMRPDYSSVVEDKFGYSATVHRTGEGTDSIKWVMYDETFDSTNPLRGLKPGSKGVFRFNIIPKKAGTYTIYFTPKITGYYAEFNTNAETDAIDPESIKTESGEYILQSLSERAAEKETEYNTYYGSDSDNDRARAALAYNDKTACENAERYLNGHMLLFEARDANGYYSIFRPINQSYSKTYTFTQQQVNDGTPIPVTIYWIWPNTFGQFLLDDGDVKLHDKAMFDSSQATIEGVTPRTEMINYICSHSNYFFETNNTSITGDGLRNYINGVVNNTSPDNLIALSNGYNNADQIIGENVQILLSEMIVSLHEE